LVLTLMAQLETNEEPQQNSKREQKSGDR